MMTDRLLSLVKPYWFRLALAMVCMAVVAGVTALMAYLVKPVLDDIFFQKKYGYPVPAAALYYPAVCR